MKIERYKILEILESLEEFSNYADVRLSYIIAKNISIIRPEIDAIKKAGEPSKEFVEFDQQRLEVCKSFATKDSHGEPIIKNGLFIITDTEKFEKNIKSLQEKYVLIIEKRNLQLEKLNVLLNDTIDIEFYKVKPEEFISDGALLKESVMKARHAGKELNFAKMLSSLCGYIVVEDDK